jgi:hypothetical protein
MESARYGFHIIIELEICPQILEKYTIIKFYANPSSGNLVFSSGQT